MYVQLNIGNMCAMMIFLWVAIFIKLSGN